jgi:hypothetical protein
MRLASLYHKCRSTFCAWVVYISQEPIEIAGRHTYRYMIPIELQLPLFNFLERPYLDLNLRHLPHNDIADYHHNRSTNRNQEWPTWLKHIAHISWTYEEKSCS